MNPISLIVRKKLSIVFISPHLDDAILSCGGLIISLKDKVEIEMVTVFSSVSTGSETQFAREFTKASGFRNSVNLFLRRKEEDRGIFKKLRLKSHYLDLVDAAWRKKNKHLVRNLLSVISPEIAHIYPKNKDVFSGNISNYDQSTLNTLNNKLSSFIEKDNYLFFCPIGIGLHVDHILVRNVCKSLFKSIIYWADFPYLLKQSPEKNFLEKNKLVSFNWNRNIGQKNKLIRVYKTQSKTLFPQNKIPYQKERYYFHKDFLKII